MIRTTAFAGALLALIAVPAAAVVKVATYTGTVYYGYDYTGEFGTANTSLIGDALITRYVYDTGIGTRSITADSDVVLGGAYYGSTNPLVSATVTIGGVTKTIANPNYIGYAYVYNRDLAVEVAEDYRSDADGDDDNYADSSIEPRTLIPTILDTSFTALALAGDGDQRIQFESDDYTLGTSHYAYAYANVSTLVVSNAIPEPTTWALLIGGFAAVGTVARRRRAVAIG